MLILGDGVDFVPRVSLLRSVIQENVSLAAEPGGGGGGVFAAGSLVATETVWRDNRAAEGDADGGGLLVTPGMEATLRDAEFTANRAARDGGFTGASAGAVTIRRSRLEGNRAAVAGGGLSSEGGPVELRESTVSDNVTDGMGGGIGSASEGEMRLDRSTVSGNRATDECHDASQCHCFR